MRWIWLPLLALAACGPPEEELPEEPKDGCVAIPAAAEAHPAGPYGSEVGEVVEDFELQDCEGATWRMSEALQSSELLLVNVGAGWCRPCIEETALLEAEVNEAFCGRGLRTVQILFQDQNLGPATPTFCREWRDTYGLTLPVLVDPFFTRETWFGDVNAQTPLNLLVTPDGVVQERFVGIAPGDELTGAIERLLE